jgi:hypothetical protein
MNAKPQSSQLQARGISLFTKPVIMGLIWSKDELDRCCCDIKLCIIASKRLEHILESHFNATGRGLHEKINSAGSLPEPVWRCSSLFDLPTLLTMSTCCCTTRRETEENSDDSFRLPVLITVSTCCCTAKTEDEEDSDNT